MVTMAAMTPTIVEARHLFTREAMPPGDGLVSRIDSTRANNKGAVQHTHRTGPILPHLSLQIEGVQIQRHDAGQVDFELDCCEIAVRIALDDRFPTRLSIAELTGT